MRSEFSLKGCKYETSLRHLNGFPDGNNIGSTGKMNIALSAFVPENLVSRDEFGSVPSRVSLLVSILRLNLVLTGFRPSSAAASIYSFITAIRHRVSPEFIRSRNCVPMAFTAESPPARGQ